MIRWSYSSALLPYLAPRRCLSGADPLDLRDLRVPAVRAVLLVHPVRRGVRVLTEPLAHQGLQDHLAVRDPAGPPARVVRRARMEPAELPVRQVATGPAEHRAHRARAEPPARREPLEQAEPPVRGQAERQGHPERGQVALPVRQERQVRALLVRVAQVARGQAGHQGHQGHQGRQAHLALRALMGRAARQALREKGHLERVARRVPREPATPRREHPGHQGQATPQAGRQERVALLVHLVFWADTFICKAPRGPRGRLPTISDGSIR